MEMITVTEVVRRMETYFRGGAHRYLKACELPAAQRAIFKSLRGPRFETTVNLLTAPDALRTAARRALHSHPPPMDGGGIMLFARDTDEIEGALKGARAVRKLGSTLPIECWLATRCPSKLKRRFDEAGVVLRQAKGKGTEVLPTSHAELRLHALSHTRLRNVIVLDPGVILPVLPERLFAARSFVMHGTVFSSTQRSAARPGVWKLCGLPVPRQSATLSTFVIDRQRRWPAIVVWRWIIDRAYFFSSYLDGEGGAAQLAFAVIKRATPVRHWITRADV